MPDEILTQRFLVWNGRCLAFPGNKQGLQNEGPGKAPPAPMVRQPHVVNLRQGAPITVPSPKVSIRIVGSSGILHLGGASEIKIHLRLKSETEIKRLLFRVYKDFTPTNKPHDVSRLVYQEVLDNQQIVALPVTADAARVPRVNFDVGTWPGDIDLPHRIVIWVSNSSDALQPHIDNLTDPGTDFEQAQYRGRTVHDQSGALWAKTKIDDKLMAKRVEKKFYTSTVKRKVLTDETKINLIEGSGFGFKLLKPPEPIPHKVALDVGGQIFNHLGAAPLLVKAVVGTGVTISSSSPLLELYNVETVALSQPIALPKTFPKAQIPEEGLKLWVAAKPAAPTALLQVRDKRLSAVLEGAPTPSRIDIPFTSGPAGEPVKRFFMESPADARLSNLIATGSFDLGVGTPDKTGFHGTNGSLMEVFQPASFKLKSTAELGRRGERQFVGGGDTFSNVGGTTDSVGFSIGSEGFGEAAAHAWVSATLPTHNLSLFTDPELAEELRLANLVAAAGRNNVNMADGAAFDNDRFLQEVKVQAAVFGCKPDEVIAHVLARKPFHSTAGYATRLQAEITFRAVLPYVPPNNFPLVFEFAVASQVYAQIGTTRDAAINKEVPLGIYLKRVFAPSPNLQAVLDRTVVLNARRGDVVGIPLESIAQLPEASPVRKAFVAKVNLLVTISRAQRAALRALERGLTQTAPLAQAFPPKIKVPEMAAQRGLRVAMTSTKTDYSTGESGTVDKLLALVDEAQAAFAKEPVHADDLHVFVAPEWYFRKKGLVPFTHAEMRAIVEELKIKTAAPKYANWLIAAGSIYFGLGYAGAKTTPITATALNDLQTYFVLHNQVAVDGAAQHAPPPNCTHYLCGNVGVLVHAGKLVHHRFKVFEHDIESEVKKLQVEQWAFDRITIAEARAIGGSSLFSLTYKGKVYNFAYEICRDHMMQSAELSYAEAYPLGGAVPVPVDVQILVCNDVKTQPHSLVAKNGGAFLRCDGAETTDKEVFVVERTTDPSQDATIYTDRLAAEALTQAAMATYVTLQEEASAARTEYQRPNATNGEKNTAKADLLRLLGIDIAVTPYDRWDGKTGTLGAAATQAALGRTNAGVAMQAIVTANKGKTAAAPTLGVRQRAGVDVDIWSGKIFG